MSHPITASNVLFVFFPPTAQNPRRAADGGQETPTRLPRRRQSSEEAREGERLRAGGEPQLVSRSPHAFLPPLQTVHVTR